MIELLASRRERVIEKALAKIFNCHGPPRYLYCVVGESFVNVELTDILREYGVEEAQCVSRIDGLPFNVSKSFNARIRNLVERNSKLSL